MTLETKETNEQFDVEIVEMFNEIIHEDNPKFDSEKNRDKVQKFLNVFEAKKYVFPQVIMEDIKVFLESLMEKCYSLFKVGIEPEKEVHKKANYQEETKEQAILRKAPNKIPVFLGIFANDEEKAKDLISGYVTSNLQWYLEQHPAEKGLESDIKNLKKEFKFPNSIHVTTLFFGWQQKQNRKCVFPKIPGRKTSCH